MNPYVNLLRMSRRSFESMESIGDGLKADIVESLRMRGCHGPHNFVESAEGPGLEGPFDDDTLDHLDEIIAGGNSQIADQLRDFR